MRHALLTAISCFRSQDFTNRRVVPADLDRVPPEDCPDSWGRRDEWLRSVREQRVRGRAAAIAHGPRQPVGEARRPWLRGLLRVGAAIGVCLVGVALAGWLK